MKANSSPMAGVARAISYPTVTAQNESWSQGRRYPVYESNIVKKKSSVPMTQLNSRGGLYEPV